VRLLREDAGLRLDIGDDGNGAPAAAERRSAGGGFGLLGMEERVLALGGSLTIRPTPPRGTLVCVRLPLDGLLRS
jgi:signal transduction histidine kinase